MSRSHAVVEILDVGVVYSQNCLYCLSLPPRSCGFSAMLHRPMRLATTTLQYISLRHTAFSGLSAHSSCLSALLLHGVQSVRSHVSSHNKFNFPLHRTYSSTRLERAWQGEFEVGGYGYSVLPVWVRL